jgi:3-phenylpropionate/trans-cinnamate dioxygenase ferredoxin reductase component
LTTQHPYVIAGGGLAGAKAAEALRQEGYDGPLVLLGQEQDRPYHRPPLSKGYLLGKETRDSLDVHPADWYADNDVDLRTGTTVSALDPGAHRLSLADGGHLDYAKLLLATGAVPRLLTAEGADLDGVLYLRRVGDSDRLKEALASARRVVVVGGGWIGLETAAAARTAGAEVTVLETAELPLLRVLGPEAARIFADLHRDHGVDLRCGAALAALTGEGGRVTGVRLTDGTTVAADAVIVGIGVTPATGLAEAAGLEVRDGVVTDQSLRTSAPDVFAAGDIANAYHPLLERHIRVEHWANALNQPLVAARAMLGTKEAVYDRLPYFFSDQYDLGMEYSGYAEAGGYDRVVFRGDTAAREFIAFWLRDGRVLAGMNVNVWDVTGPVQTLIRARTQVDPDALADPGVPLESFTQE